MVKEGIRLDVKVMGDHGPIYHRLSEDMFGEDAEGIKKLLTDPDKIPTMINFTDTSGRLVIIHGDVFNNTIFDITFIPELEE